MAILMPFESTTINLIELLSSWFKKERKKEGRKKREREREGKKERKRKREGRKERKELRKKKKKDNGHMDLASHGEIRCNPAVS